MDIAAQILLSSSILLLGSLALIPLRFEVNILAYISTSWFLGWVLIVMAEIVLVVLGIQATLVQLLVISAFYLVVIFFLKKRGKQKINWMALFKSLTIITYVAIFFSFYIFAKYLNYSHHSTDSLQNEQLSWIFHSYGLYRNENSFVSFLLFNKRLPFFIAIHNIAYLFTIKSFYVFQIASSFFVALFLLGVWFTTYQKNSYLKILVVFFVVIGFYFANKLILFHSFYPLSNLTTMTYFTAGVLLLYVYSMRSKEVFFILGCVFLGITCILRKEMLIFSLIPLFSICFFCQVEIWTRLKGLINYVLFGYLWYIYGVFTYYGTKREFSENFISNIEEYGIVLLCFVCSIILLCLPIRTYYKNHKLLLVVIGSVFLLVILYLLRLELVITSQNLYSLMYKGAGLWGTEWSVLAVLMAGFLLYDIVYKFFSFTKNRSNQYFLFSVIVLFFICRIILYSILEFPKDKTWNNSGNRILLTIFPTCLLFLCERFFSIGNQAIFFTRETYSKIINYSFLKQSKWIL